MELLDYSEVLERLSKEQPDQCHLLLGNGFNNSLGIQTSYEEIFKRMMKNVPTYQKIEGLLSGKKYNVEWLIKESKSIVTKDETEVTPFLEFYIERKIKFDFMLATSEISMEKIKNVYQGKNNEIYLLFKHFSNYFTLNYDPFLYLLLMKFKKKSLKGLGDNSALAFQNTSLFKTEELDQEQNDIYKKIKEFRKNGFTAYGVNGDTLTQHKLKTAAKVIFVNDSKSYAKDTGKSWPAKSIEMVVDKILDEENKNQHLQTINDGFFGDEFAEHETKQNIFFLHGAFHIFEKKKYIYKITQTQNKALYERLAKVIDSEEEDIVCVLTGTSEEKRQQINENVYLEKAHEKLSNLQGNMMILGSSLAENDAHIFKAINLSELNHIYISSFEGAKEKDSKRAGTLLPDKNVTLFDCNTISYNSDNSKE